MDNFELLADEVVLYEGSVSSNQHKGRLLITLTSKKIVLEQEKGLFKKILELVDIIDLTTVKFYNDAVQIKQKGADVTVQTTSGNVTFTFSGMFEAGKFKGKIVDTVTGTTLARRVSDKTKGAIDMVDETLGLDTRSTIKGVLEQGIKGAIFNGIGKKE